MAFLLASIVLLNLPLASAKRSHQSRVSGNRSESCSHSHNRHHSHHGHGGKTSHMRQQVAQGDYNQRQADYAKGGSAQPDYGSESYNPNSNLLGIDLLHSIQLGFGRETNTKGKKYNLTLNSAGNKFFDDWDFFSDGEE